mmetsp:Transcript_71270/g.190277  ORF Transcript_71270/g.190277 Transcript_71270/m.190277 type:complete len:495 (-) Transcript_71270:90-1574(-)
METSAPVLSTSFQLQEGAYKVEGTFSSPNAKALASQRATKASYLRVTAPRPPSSPAAKSKGRLSFAKRASSPAKAAQSSGGAGGGLAGDRQSTGSSSSPLGLGPSDERPGVEYLALPAGDLLCVLNLGTLTTDVNQREKRLPADLACCAINPRTSSLENLDIMVGLENGELLLIDGITLAVRGKFNTGGQLNNARLMDVKWSPTSPTQFVAAFGNGVLLVLDKDKDDGSNKSSGSSADSSERGGDGVSISHPKGSKTNPLARWLVGRGPINHVSFSTDGKMMALSCHDGFVRVFDFASEKLLFSIRSQYGAMLCSAWSPDNLYLVTGGEDDLVMVWNVRDRCAVAKCQGHNSWVSAVAFDASMCVLDADPVPGVASICSYRIVSVGQDGRLCIWDLSEGNIVVSRKRQPNGPRPSIGSPAAPPRAGVVEAPRDECPHMEAALSLLIDQEPLCNVFSTPSGISTSSFSGFAKFWGRPAPPMLPPPADERSAIGVA